MIRMNSAVCYKRRALESSPGQFAELLDASLTELYDDTLDRKRRRDTQLGLVEHPELSEAFALRIHAVSMSPQIRRNIEERFPSIF